MPFLLEGTWWTPRVKDPACHGVNVRWETLYPLLLSLSLCVNKLESRRRSTSEQTFSLNLKHFQSAQSCVHLSVLCPGQICVYSRFFLDFVCTLHALPVKCALFSLWTPLECHRVEQHSRAANSRIRRQYLFNSRLQLHSFFNPRKKTKKTLCNIYCGYKEDRTTCNMQSYAALLTCCNIDYFRIFYLFCLDI